MTVSSPFRLATLNTWHGLNGEGVVRFGSLESRRERLSRLERQLSCLKSIDADVYLLQEVNPLPFRAHWYAQHLGKRCYFAASNAGLKLGWGLPTNLDEGLAILVPHGWDAEFLGKKRLSGDFQLFPLRVAKVFNPFLSVQLHESRIAIAVRLYLPPSRCFSGEAVGASGGADRASVLLVTTHLHHVHEMTPQVQVELDRLSEVTPPTKEERAFIDATFSRALRRRQEEVETLSAWIHEIRRPQEVVLVGGDFNYEPTSSNYMQLVKKGWVDLWRCAENVEDSAGAATWYPSQNPFAARSRFFAHPDMGEKLGGNKKSIVPLFMQNIDMLPRRIDYLFAVPPRSEERNEVRSREMPFGYLGSLGQVSRFGFLTGNPLSHKGLLTTDFQNLGPESDTAFVSDHFGLVADFLSTSL